MKPKKMKALEEAARQERLKNRAGYVGKYYKDQGERYYWVCSMDDRGVLQGTVFNIDIDRKDTPKTLFFCPYFGFGLEIGLTEITKAEWFSNLARCIQATTDVYAYAATPAPVMEFPE